MDRCTAFVQNAIVDGLFKRIKIKTKSGTSKIEFNDEAIPALNEQ